MSKQASKPKRLTPKEAIYAFTSWLSTRKNPIILSAKHDPSALVPLISAFGKVNGLPNVRDHYTNAYVLPTNDPDLDNVTNDPALSPNKAARHWTAQEVLDAVEGPLLCLSGEDQMKVVAKLLRQVHKQHELRIESDDKMVGRLPPADRQGAGLPVQPRKGDEGGGRNFVAMTEPISTVFNEDCLPALRGYPDGFWDLAVIDPPYGIDASNMKLGEWAANPHSGPKPYKRGDWDRAAASPEYFRELLRLAKHAVVWGANHFVNNLPEDRRNSSCWVAWDKNNGETSFADVELAWTTFESPARLVKFTWSGYIQGRMGHEKETRIHPTQKPVYLYRWLLTKFALDKEGQVTHRRILDTHMGSQSSRIAAWKMGLDYWGWEIDADYFREGNKRFDIERGIQTLF